eukprot:1192465-Prorocentrum_minimum.AAC.4
MCRLVRSFGEATGPALESKGGYISCFSASCISVLASLKHKSSWYFRYHIPFQQAEGLKTTRHLYCEGEAVY